ncbi:type II secretion system protein GspL [Trichlorobacter lovleyi]|uniref:type II secretion system protein GspL n=1 Tax=Trichlorobacter lovleyi TaxID=313985 RepID=UPI00223F4868|nr:type II secretion system protein GspL [Trichlorobacter lovleyi]QOX78398.1 type II secretion system protein GspL [Trichlorobacter lovleyi]
MIIHVIQLHESGFTIGRFRHAGRELVPLTGIQHQTENREELVSRLRDTLAAVTKGETRTILSVPPRLLNLRELQLPITERAKIQAVLPFELAGETAQDDATIVCDAVALAGGGQLAGWAAQGQIADLIDTLTEAGAEPEIVTVSCLNWNLLLPPDSAETVAICDSSAVAVCRQGQLLFCRTLTGNSDDLERTLATLELTRNLQVDRVLLLDPLLLPLAATSERTIEPFPLPDALKTPVSQDGLAPLALAAPFAAALAVCFGEPFNLRTGPLAWKQKNKRLLRTIRLPLILACVAAVLLLAEAGTRWYLLARDIASLNSSIGKIYRESFPKRKKAVDEAAELKAEIRRLEGNSLSPVILPFLRLLTEQKSAEINGFSEIDYDGTRFKVKGDGRTSAAISTLRQKLVTAGWQVEQPEITSRPDGTVLFQLKGTRGGTKP